MAREIRDNGQSQELLARIEQADNTNVSVLAQIIYDGRDLPDPEHIGLIRAARLRAGGSWDAVLEEVYKLEPKQAGES